jgi:magnesium and cobalt exporter, CNNM family
VGLSVTAVWAGGVALLVLLSALLAAAETAVFSVGSARLRTLVEEGFDGADALARVRGRSPSLQTAVHLLITILNLVAVGLAVALGARLDGVRGSLLALGSIVVVLVLVAEILPPALAARRPIRMALTSAPGLLRMERWIGGLLSPFLRLEALISGLGDEEADTGEREVRELAALGREEGVVNRDEHALVERAFRLDEQKAFDVMTPRVDIFAWRDTQTLQEIISQLESVPYSRVPVYHDSIDDITGILYVREAYETWVSGRRDALLSSLAREAFFLPGSVSLAQLLRDFQARRIHMAIVADEFGGTDGLVTLEDVLEELVGEIVDETDVEEDDLLRLSSDELVADGSVDLREINDALGLSLPTVENRSLNGFILEELGYVPDAGESLEREGVRIEVLQATDTLVVRARLLRLPDDRRAADDER